ncbi:MAG: hypothetical protein L0Z53_07420 [Acidobacteriales bacterium]|nr:hypothetical protein [Terriglobales bacterium]MCI0418503.1 hypothetical protein [Acidobacteriota bacterium]MCI0627257.1 hypothetical protein [Acidobacteriota bacterium]MCI0723678.1 hypothetical protein [Acidobacteriota bacterium]
MKTRWIVCSLLPLFTCSSAFGQQPASKSTESHKYRTIFTIAGGGGGFAVGVFAGLAAFDDAINSDRKVWTTAILSAAGGAVGGYFLGRALDKRHKKTNIPWKPDDPQRSLIPSQWAALRANEVRHTGQAADSGILRGSRQGAGSGSLNQTSASLSSLDINNLYLLSAIRRMEAVAD